ncbi:MAG: PASTA domain-containing protein [Acidobacteria bacterium]|nr:PASTA domain-containing protein [Acidobacteriota bacterium]
MASNTRTRKIGRALLLAAALAGTYALFTVATMRVALRAREVAVPSVVGLEAAEATGAMESAGLTVRVDDNRPFDSKVPLGRIASQDPVAGLAVRRGRSVRVWISAGSRSSLVPKLIGETERTAMARLQQDGLELAGTADVRSSELPMDAIVAQQPGPGSRNARVGLLVNRGERAGGYVMPDVIGVSADAAVDLLRSRGLRVAIVAQQPYPGVPSGVILRQSPAAGFQITPDQPISLEVSR